MKEHDATPELTSPQAMQDWLKELIENASWDNGLYETEVLTFEETLFRRIAKGLSLYLPDGSLFRLYIVKER